MAAVLRGVDLVLLAIALPVFLIAGWPIFAYLVVAAVWIAGRAIQRVADRRSAAALARGDHRSALGIRAVMILARVWVLAAVILIVGLAVDRETGLAAALLAAAVFTVYLIGLVAAQLVAAEDVG